VKILHLHLKYKWFDLIKSGKKKIEYREVTEYWEKRLVSRKYDFIFIYKGYPKKDNEGHYKAGDLLIFDYDGYELKKIVHPNTKVECECFCIFLNTQR
jgi:hypothetical protein